MAKNKSDLLVSPDRNHNGYYLGYYIRIDKSTDPPRAFAGRHPLLPFRAGLYMYLVYLAEGVVCPE